MRINVVIDEKLMIQAMEISGAKTRAEAVELGLRALLRVSRQAEFRRLRGTVAWKGNLAASRLDRR